MLDVLAFWFEECRPEHWFQKDSAFDDTIRARFAGEVERALRGELQPSTADERLGLILLLDQFPRNLYRGSAKSFAGDAKAVALVDTCVAQGDLERDADPDRRRFLLMPLMHSEDLQVHERAAALFARYTSELVQDYAKRHRAIIERFGRYPHRNDALGRASSDEELAFLKGPDSGF
ncbi:MAG: DUF924 family protein [Myxococcota bacterium]